MGDGLSDGWVEVAEGLGGATVGVVAGATAGVGNGVFNETLPSYTRLSLKRNY